MIRSMTGFGAAEGEVGGARVAVELRSVNHRFFNPSIKLPSAFARWEGDVRESLRQRVARGHVTCLARIEQVTPDAGRGIVDENRFAAYVKQLRALQERHGLSGSLDVATVLRMPDVFVGGEESEATGTVGELVAIVDAAATALNEMRAQEGARLAAELRARLDVIEGALGRIAERAPHRLTEQRDRLRAAVRELTGGAGVDEQRVAQEVAILADRLDVAEELTRFGSHLAAFRAALTDAGAEPVGKRLGFLLQEMLREANTTGSKGNDTVIVSEVLGIKEELERIREQVENLE